MGILNISEARARLPELARKLVREPGSVAYIAHRDLGDDLALTTRSHLEYLERSLAELRKRVGAPFVLAGSIRTVREGAELETALDALRRDAAAAALERAASFAE